MRLLLVATASVALMLAFARVPTSADVNMMMSPRDQGMYIVAGVGKCGDCHGANFHGAALPFVPAPGVKMPWASRAPAIAGLPMFKTNAQAVHFMETGIMPDGSRPLPPMPQYRLDSYDAQAVVMYLRSLK